MICTKYMLDTWPLQPVTWANLVWISEVQYRSHYCEYYKEGKDTNTHSSGIWLKESSPVVAHPGKGIAAGRLGYPTSNLNRMRW